MLRGGFTPLPRETKPTRFPGFSYHVIIAICVAVFLHVMHA